MVAGARSGAWLNLLASAAAQTEERARRLVVVVDGLDEDDAGATPSRGRPSIASLLPRRPPPGVRFIVTSRPDPGLPDDLPMTSHPLRTCNPHSLPDSLVSQGIGNGAPSRNCRTCSPAIRSRSTWSVTSPGPAAALPASDLSALTGASPHKLDPILRGVSGRSFQTRASADPRQLAAGSRDARLPVRARDLAGHRRGTTRQPSSPATGKKCMNGSSSYARAGWPDTTPGYAIRGYPAPAGGYHRHNETVRAGPRSPQARVSPAGHRKRLRRPHRDQDCSESHRRSKRPGPAGPYRAGRLPARHLDP